MISIGIFDNTNLNYVYKYLKDVHNINITKDFKVYNAFAYKNIRNYYDILLILSKITEHNIEKVKHIVERTNILIFNSDDKELHKIIESSNLENKYILDYGFNSKSTFTISSVDPIDDSAICMLQKKIVNIYNNENEIKEMKIYKNGIKFNNDKLMGIILLVIVLGYM